MADKDNIQFAEQAIAAINARDIDRYLQRIDESYVGESEIAPGPIRGHQGVRQMMEMQLKAFPDLHIDIEQILPSGDHVVVRARLTGTHKGNFAGIAPTNKSVTWRACNIVEVRNGKAVRSRIYADNATLFEQLGVLSIPRAKAAG
jgi:steroid delta-isomerase-like uncharacterized protein